MKQPLTTAEVRAHNRVVRYRREGSTGPTVLLLVADSTSDLWPDFPNLLAERFRVVIPDLPEQPSQATQALRSLLDGLGCSGAPLIAAGRYCDTALELALEQNEAVGRVVLVAEGTEDEGPVVQAVSDPAMRVLPVAVVSRQVTVEEAIERVAEALGTG